MTNSTANGFMYTAFAVSGASTVAPSDIKAIQFQAYANGAFGQLGETFLVTGLTAGSNTFTMQYRAGSNTGTWANRIISVVPL